MRRRVEGQFDDANDYETFQRENDELKEELTSRVR